MAAIHAECFEHSWSQESFCTLLGSPGVFGLLTCRAHGQIGSFVLVRVAADEAEILTLATLPAERRSGSASGLVRTAIEQAKKRGAVRCFLEVAETNQPALSLYHKLDFEQVALRPHYYESRTHAGVAAVVMRREL
ncbi:MAG TPA: GNAT family N-acetyltransferase [Micropepsaceae bacterium]|nr:GNAT family N-acetyltransferase [Micropepsaceae bacterium]